MEFHAADPAEREAWVRVLWAQICSCVQTASDAPLAPGWRHKYLRGTLHSAVVCDEEELVAGLLMRSAGQSAGAKATRVIRANAVDDDGLTALAYACMRGRCNLMRMLLEAGADPTKQDHRGRTPIHMAALQLDHAALKLLCRCVLIYLQMCGGSISAMCGPQLLARPLTLNLPPLFRIIVVTFPTPMGCWTSKDSARWLLPRSKVAWRRAAGQRTWH